MKNNKRNNNTRGNITARDKQCVLINDSVYNEIVNTIGSIDPEQGGILGSSSNDGVIDHFVHDSNAQVGYASYTPNIEFLEETINNSWYKDGVELFGFIHSHPARCKSLSGADVEYACRIMSAIGYESLFMPIVNLDKKQGFRMYGYIINIDGRVEDCDIEIVKKSKTTDDKANEDTNKEENSFTRINEALPLDYLTKSSIIGIGCGGSREFYLDMARLGVGNFYLMDGDTVSITNIATQNTFISEVGKSKCECIKRQILDINPSCNVVCINIMLDDNVTDDLIEAEIINKVDKNNSIICGFTDSFFAQARVNNIGMKYHLPILTAQHHRYGETSEIIYYYPGVSNTTIRDILDSRYNAYLNGFKNNVTSKGGVIFGTTRLNSLCAKLAVGMLLYSFDSNNVFSSFLSLRPEANLVIIKQYPNVYGELRGLFLNDNDNFFDHPVWIDTYYYNRDIVISIDDTRKIE